MSWTSTSTSTTTKKNTFWERLERIKRGEDPKKLLEECCNVDEGNYKSLIAKRVALKFAPFIVSLSSFVGDECLCARSGILIEWVDDVGTILTSATLLTGHLGHVPSDVTVKVYLPDCGTVSGTISHFDLHHNLATVEITSVSKLQVVEFPPDAKLYYPGQKVVAISRRPIRNDLLAGYGEILSVDNGFDSEDLIYSSCSVCQYGVGGPLVDISSGSLVGMNFAGKRCTGFLPIPIVLRCLKHFMTYGRVHRPWLGIRTRDLGTLKIAELEKIFRNVSNISGIYVDKVIEGSPAASAGLCSGDIVTHFDGIPVYHRLEFIELLFKKAEDIMEHSSRSAAASESPSKRRAIAVEVVIARGNSCCSSESKTIIIDDRFSPSVINRWPLYRPQNRTKKY